MIWSLVRKPGAFARYVYREELFPSLDVPARLRRASATAQPGVRGDLEYLRILHLAASTMEADVEAALELLLAEGRRVTADAVKALVNGAAARRGARARGPSRSTSAPTTRCSQEVGA